jgi:hypothetical protein
MARMAEQAFAAERSDDDMRLSGEYWDAENVGLLAGERLLTDLQAMERQYIEKNYRQLEVEQSFSLAQVAPDLLVQLRLTGECEFTVPELFFDVTYPGHYRRRLKAVRVTIPCVTGPYTNVGATLRLVSSSIRLKPSDDPVAVPPRHTVSIAASKGQYDAGVLDFNFRDERYMPFEGAGAIGKWNLSLPSTIRVFDYSTISDVILHLSYTADFDGALKNRLETEIGDAAGSLLTLLKVRDADPAPLARVFSLRQDFPDVFRRLMTNPLNTNVDLVVEDRHFPLFLKGHTLKAKTATVTALSSLNALASQAAGKFTLALKQQNATPAQDFLELPAPSTPGEGTTIKRFDFGNILKKAADPGGLALGVIGEYVLAVKASGPLAPAQAGQGTVDSDKLRDILIEVTYGLA